MEFIKTIDWPKRIEQALIFIAHIALLKWMLFVLYEGGNMQMQQMIFHFVGMAISGGLLIRITAFLYQRRHQREQQA